MARWYCAICSEPKKTPGRFIDHCLTHGASRAVLERSARQIREGGATLVVSEGGRLMVMLQAPLLL